MSKPVSNISKECLDQIGVNIAQAIKAYYDAGSWNTATDKATAGVAQSIADLTVQITPACQADVTKGKAAQQR